LTTPSPIEPSAVEHLIFIGTPLAPQGNTEEERQQDLARNISFAEATCRALALAGAATFGPHLYYTRFLSDRLAAEREIGIRLGLIHMRRSDEVLFRLPPWRGAFSTGMTSEKGNAESLGKRVTVCTTATEFADYVMYVRALLRVRT